MIEFFDIYTGEKIQSFPIPIYKKYLKMGPRVNVETKSVEIVAENKSQPLATEGKSQIFDKKFLKTNLCTSGNSHDSKGARYQWERGFTKNIQQKTRTRSKSLRHSKQTNQLLHSVKDPDR